MNSFLKKAQIVMASLAATLAMLVVSGCSTVEPSSQQSSGSPGTSSGSPSVAAPAPNAQPQAQSDVLLAGDPIRIVFSGVSDPPPIVDERIKTDGTLKLPYIDDPIMARGKTRGQLEQEIHDKYVPNYYRRLTVKVGSENRYVTVSGQVRTPGRVQFINATTVTKVIAAAGDFTDFANRKRVLLRRATGQTIEVNCIKALKDPKYDVAVFPDDQIEVPRRLF